MRVLVARGIVRGKRVPGTIWVDRESLTSFTDSHVSILSISKRVGKGPKALINYCFRKKIYTLVVIQGVKVQSRHAFVHREDVGKVLKGAKSMPDGYKLRE